MAERAHPNLEDVLSLMHTSAHHRAYTVDQVLRCIAPPLRLGQCTWVWNSDRLQGWLSWAWMTPRAMQAFLDGEHKVRPADWRAGEELVFMDVIARPGFAAPLFKQTKTVLGHHARAVGIRHAKNNRIMRIKNVQ